MTRACLLAVGLLLASPALAQIEEPPDHFSRERMRAQSQRRKRDREPPAFVFAAPDGWTATKPAEADDDPPALAATGEGGATMTARIEKGRVSIDDAFVADAAKKIVEQIAAAHKDGTGKVLKKDLVKLDGGPAAHVVVEVRADKKKSTKPTREVHYIVGNATHHAHVTYAAPAAAFGKLEKAFDASLRKTTGLAVPTGKTAEPPPRAR